MSSRRRSRSSSSSSSSSIVAAAAGVVVVVVVVVVLLLLLLVVPRACICDRGMFYTFCKNRCIITNSRQQIHTIYSQMCAPWSNSNNQ